METPQQRSNICPWERRFRTPTSVFACLPHSHCWKRLFLRHCVYSIIPDRRLRCLYQSKSISLHFFVINLGQRLTYLLAVAYLPLGVNLVKINCIYAFFLACSGLEPQLTACGLATLSISECGTLRGRRPLECSRRRHMLG